MEETKVSSTIPLIVETKEVKVEKEELPKIYGETKIMLLPRDPFWAFAYWEISEKTKKEFEEKLKVAQLNLRVYDVTGIDFDGTNANSYFDIQVSELADNWYINLPQMNRSWCVDLGLKYPDGSFEMITRSNIVHAPRYGVSPITDEQWAMLQKDFERLLEISGISQIGKGSFDVAKLMRERWEEIVSISSLAVASPVRVAIPQIEVEIPKREFFLQAETDVVVYGKTEPDASLSIAGKDVGINPDGSFSVRFSLKEGEIEIPIEAENKNKTQKRKLNFKIIRKTI